MIKSLLNDIREFFWPRIGSARARWVAKVCSVITFLGVMGLLTKCFGLAFSVIATKM